MSVTTPRHYTTEELLRDGESICIRAIRPDDTQRLLALFERLSSRSVYFRFFQTKQRLTDEELRAFTELDFARNVALVATLRDGDAEHIVGVGRYCGLDEDGTPIPRAEVAFEVADAHQGRGIGTLLLEHLAAIARAHGIDTFEAYVLGENNRMLQVFDTSGFRVQRALETGVFHVAFPTAESPGCAQPARGGGCGSLAAWRGRWRHGAGQSAALATSDTAVEALFEQAGVIRANTLQELFDVAMLLSTQPLPLGPCLGVVTNAGGPGILLADMAETHGLTLPALTPETCAALRTFLPAQAGLANPVDMIASATPEQYARTIEAVGNDANIDAVVVIYIPPLVTDPTDIAQAIARGAGTVPAQKPLLTVFMSSHGAPAALNAGARRTIPSYAFPENAALALAAAVRYGRWRARPRGTPLTLSPFAHSAVRAVMDRVLANAAGPLWLQPGDLATVLQAVGIPLAAAEQTTPEVYGRTTPTPTMNAVVLVLPFP